MRLTRQADEDMDASAGAAFYLEDATDAAALIRLADERMYALKQAHRDPRGAGH